MKKSIAFVASTMPARYIASEVAAGRIGTVYTSSARLVSSYKVVVGTANDVEVVALPSSGFGQLILLVKLLLKSRFENRAIVFFHESCFMSLDIAIWICRPRGLFMPVSNLSTYNQLESAGVRLYFRSTKHGTIVSWCLSKMFDIYDQTNDGGNSKLYVPVVKGYPCSIEIDAESGQLRNRLSEDVEKSRVVLKSILFLVGTDAVDSNYLADTYLSLMSEAQECGLNVHIKDHPNPEMRSNLIFSGAKILDPLTPAEILEDCYLYVVSVASAGLAIYGNKGVSIVGMLQEMAPEVRAMRKGYIKSISENVNFVNSSSEFTTLCKTVLC